MKFISFIYQQPGDYLYTSHQAIEAMRERGAIAILKGWEFGKILFHNPPREIIANGQSDFFPEGAQRWFHWALKDAVYAGGFFLMERKQVRHVAEDDIRAMAPGLSHWGLLSDFNLPLPYPDARQCARGGCRVD